MGAADWRISADDLAMQRGRPAGASSPVSCGPSQMSVTGLLVTTSSVTESSVMASSVMCRADTELAPGEMESRRPAAAAGDGRRGHGRRRLRNVRADAVDMHDHVVAAVATAPPCCCPLGPVTAAVNGASSTCYHCYRPGPDCARGRQRCFRERVTYSFPLTEERRPAARSRPRSLSLGCVSSAVDLTAAWSAPGRPDTALVRTLSAGARRPEEARLLRVPNSPAAALSSSPVSSQLSFDSAIDMRLPGSEDEASPSADFFLFPSSQPPPAPAPVIVPPAVVVSDYSYPECAPEGSTELAADMLSVVSSLQRHASSGSLTDSLRSVWSDSSFSFDDDEDDALRAKKVREVVSRNRHGGQRGGSTGISMILTSQ